MELKQIEYIVKIAEEKSITHAAEKLYLTQSALNQQLLKLEKELGAPLFYRSKTDWRPTPVGEIYLENAREILRIRHKTYNMISDMIASGKGRLSIGFTPGRGIDMFTHVYPAFHKQYPDILVEPHELSVHAQQKKIAAGDLDIGFQTLSYEQRTKDTYVELGSEELLIAVPRAHPLVSSHTAVRTPDGAYPVLDISCLKEDSFVLMYRESTVRSIVDELFRRSGFVPKVLFETSSNSTILSMVQSNQCCGVIPYHYVKQDPEGIACFAFPSHPRWDIVASYRHHSYLSLPAKAFIALAGDYWNGSLHCL